MCSSGIASGLDSVLSGQQLWVKLKFLSDLLLKYEGKAIHVSEYLVKRKELEFCSWRT